MRSTRPSLCLLTGCMLTADVVADNYNYEVGVSYTRGQSNGSFTPSIFIGPTPPPTVISSSDTDAIDLIGIWYYAALSDDQGPKSRAALLSRASSLSLAYDYNDTSTTTTTVAPPTGPLGALNLSSTSKILAANVKHVFRNSDWYVVGGVASISADFEVGGSIGATSDLDASAYSFGVGKYFGKSTTLDLNVARADTDGADTTVIALNLTHVGAMGANWQYGADLGVSESDQDSSDVSYQATLSLYPTNEVAFGIGISRQDGGAGFDSNSYELFGSWFVRQNVELSARYQEDDPDVPSGQSVDSDQVGIGVGVRF